MSDPIPDSVELNLSPKQQPQPGDAPASDCPTPWHWRKADIPGTVVQVFAADGTLVFTVNSTSRVALRCPDDPAAVARRVVDAVNNYECTKGKAVAS